MAVCMIFAWLLQLLIQMPSAKKFGYKFSLKINFKDENIKKVFILAIPIFTVNPKVSYISFWSFLANSIGSPLIKRHFP